MKKTCCVLKVVLLELPLKIYIFYLGSPKAFTSPVKERVTCQLQGNNLKFLIGSLGM